MLADSSTDAVKLQPNTASNRIPRAYMEMPEEKTVITAKVRAFSARVF